MIQLPLSLTRPPQQDNSDEAQEEFGWKLVHGDVFRSPADPILFSTMLGNGTQVLSMFFITLLFACFGFLSPGMHSRRFNPMSASNHHSQSGRPHDVGGRAVLPLLLSRWIRHCSLLQGMLATVLPCIVTGLFADAWG